VIPHGEAIFGRGRERVFRREPVVHREPARARCAAERGEKRVMDRTRFRDETSAMEIEDDTALRRVGRHDPPGFRLADPECRRCLE
jgi:hypothetical protein